MKSFIRNNDIINFSLFGMKAFWKGLITSGRISLILLAIVLVMIFKMTLHKDIGLGLEGLLVLEISPIPGATKLFLWIIIVSSVGKTYLRCFSY